MTNLEFNYWIDGFISLESIEESNMVFNAKQLWIINNHLNLVEKIDGHLTKKNARLKNYLFMLSTRDSKSLLYPGITDVIGNWRKQPAEV